MKGYRWEREKMAMSSDALLGPSFAEHGWVPAPRYLMRRARIFEMMRGMKPGRLLEIGPGAGTLLIEFARLGYRCEALESSGDARELSRKLVAASGQSVEIRDRARSDWQGKFDYLFAFDVLEHIDDDAGALENWASWLKPNGLILLSVPARLRLWTAGDEWAGHYRRYEQDQLITLLERAGFALETFECYGFPLANLSERVSAAGYRKAINNRAATGDSSRQANNDRSGIDRRRHTRLYPLLSSPPGRLAIRLFLAAQNLFLRQDWGSGYIVRARKR